MTPDEMQENIEYLKRMSRNGKCRILKIQLVPEDYDRFSSAMETVADIEHHPIKTLFGYPVECRRGLWCSRILVYIDGGVVDVVLNMSHVRGII